MKPKLNLIFILFQLFCCFSVFAQFEITEEDKKNQELRLKEDPRDFAANFVVGAWYYNQAVDPHTETTKMNFPEYIEKGTSLEKQKKDFLIKSLPYFENAYTIKKDDQVKEVLKNIYQQLGYIKANRATPKQIEAELEARLNQITFKPLE